MHKSEATAGLIPGSNGASAVMFQKSLPYQEKVVFLQRNQKTNNHEKEFHKDNPGSGSLSAAEPVFCWLPEGRKE